MSYQVLARKWRPKKFENVIGQEHVSRSLQQSLLNNKLAHAYLFTGTRGVGKTTFARIFAKAIRCEHRDEQGNPCLKCPSCLEIEQGEGLNYLEIDGASHNSVDDVRNLVENVSYLPSSGMYKIYVIDEVHMLSSSAFNALLKTLEEPPAHVKFIFATTDPQKLLGTVLSRCQRFDLRMVSVENLEGLIKQIAAQENIKFQSQKLIHKLAKFGKGSARDTLSLLDQCWGLSEGGLITEEGFAKSLGLVTEDVLAEMLTALFHADSEKVSSLLRVLIQENTDLENFSGQLIEELYRLCREDYSNSAEEKSFQVYERAEKFWIFETLVKDKKWIFESDYPDLGLEISLLKISKRNEFLSQKKKPIASRAPKASTAPKEVVRKLLWEKVLLELDQQSANLSANLRQGNLLTPISYGQNEVIVHYGFKEKDSIAREILEEKEIFSKLKKELARIFNVAQENLNFRSEVVKENATFQSINEILDKERRLEEKSDTENFVDNPMVKEIESLFNTKIEKVVLTKKDMR